MPRRCHHKFFHWVQHFCFCKQPGERSTKALLLHHNNMLLLQSLATLIATIVITSVCAIGLTVVLLGPALESLRTQVLLKRAIYWRNLSRRNIWASMYSLVPRAHDERNDGERNGGEFLRYGLFICDIKPAKISSRE